MDAFGTVVIVLAVVALVVAAISFWGSGSAYRSIGRGGLGMERDEGARGPGAAAPVPAAVVDEEIRQMLEAKSARRQARGEPALDVDAELNALREESAGHDPALREEVRQLVVARNERRARQGKEPLDVDAEVERQLRDLGA